jgi:hypothetical protein
MLNSWSHCVIADENLGLKVVNGRVVEKYPDAQEKPHPVILQGLIARKLSNEGEYIEQPMVRDAEEKTRALESL